MNSERDHTDWRECYRLALFEPDPEKLASRLEAAREAIRCRTRELWEARPADLCERSQLDSASYFLGLLRTIAEQKEDSGVPINPD